MQVTHTRQCMTFLDLLSGVGGVFGLLMKLFGYTINPWAKFKLTITALKRMYLVKTKDSELFKKPTKLKTKDGKWINQTLKSELPDDPTLNKRFVEKSKIDYPVKMSNFRLLQLYIVTQVLCCFPQTRKTKRLKRLIEHGNQKLDSDLQIDNVVR